MFFRKYYYGLLFKIIASISNTVLITNEPCSSFQCCLLVRIPQVCWLMAQLGFQSAARLILRQLFYCGPSSAARLDLHHLLFASCHSSAVFSQLLTAFGMGRPKLLRSRSSSAVLLEAIPYLTGLAYSSSKMNFNSCWPDVDLPSHTTVQIPPSFFLQLLAF